MKNGSDSTKRTKKNRKTMKKKTKHILYQQSNTSFNVFLVGKNEFGVIFQI